MSLLFQRFRYSFDASFTIELSATSQLTSLHNAVGMLRTVLREEREIGCIRTLVRITFFLDHFVIARRSSFVCILFTGNSLCVTVTIVIAAATATGTLLGWLLGRLFECLLLWLHRQNIRWKKKKNDNSIISLDTESDLTQIANYKLRWIIESNKIVANGRHYMNRTNEATMLGIQIQSDYVKWLIYSHRSDTMSPSRTAKIKLRKTFTFFTIQQLRRVNLDKISLRFFFLLFTNRRCRSINSPLGNTESGSPI